MSKPCANCGAEIPEGAPFCDNCGMPASEAAPPTRKAQPPPTLPEESTPDQRSRLEQNERSPATLLNGTPDPDIGELRRGVPGWAIWAAGLVGTAARQVPRWAIGAAAGLVAMMVARRQGADAIQENPTADSATQQNMGVAEAVAQDPAPIGEADADLVGAISPASAVTELPGPTIDTGLVEPSADLVNMGNPELVNAINENPDVIDAMQQDPAPIGQVQQEPSVIDKLAMTTQSPVDEVGGLPPVGPEVGGPPDQATGMDLDLALFDRSVSRPTLDPCLLDEASPGPTLDAGLLDPNSPGPTVDANLLDPNASGATIDPALLDPSAPGPTIDPNLLDPNSPGQTIDPTLLDPNAPGPTIDLSTLEQSLMEPGEDLSDVTTVSVTEPDVPEPGPPDQDFDDTPTM